MLRWVLLDVQTRPQTGISNKFTPLSFLVDASVKDTECHKLSIILPGLCVCVKFVQLGSLCFVVYIKYVELCVV